MAAHGRPTVGMAHWLEAAPPTASFAEVADAYKRYDSPHEAWPGGNQRIDTYGGSK